MKKCNTYISMNKLILTGLLAAGAMTHIQGAQFAGQENQQQDPKDKSRRPNILFILSDDHTSQAWGIYGGVLADYAYNSNIRRLANEGVVLDNCFCTNSISAPSRASILTGLYSHRNGLYTLADSLDTSIPTLATVLQANGYNTGLVGKWHIKSQPQGFDYYSIFYDQGEYRDPTFIESSDPWPGNRPFGERVPGFSTDLVAEKAINWIKQQDSNQPFLMCCHFKATHEPYDYPTRMEHLYDGVTFPEPENFLDWGPETNGRSFKGQTLEELGHRWRVASKDPDKWWCRYPGLPFNTDGMQRTTARRAIYQKLIRDYLRCGATIDDNIGKLLKTLDEMGIADNTIVVYVSDQGYFLGEHGFFDKRMFYEEAARMPFVIRYPKKIPAGKRLKDLILNVDFAPTLAEFAGVKMENVQGHSFTGNLEGKTPADWRKEIYYRYWTNHAIRPAHFAIRSERYKLIFYYAKNLDMTDTENFDFTPAWDFYDLEEDPHENHNLYNDPKYAPIIRQMKKAVLFSKVLSDKEISQLVAKGYTRNTDERILDWIPYADTRSLLAWSDGNYEFVTSDGIKREVKVEKIGSPVMINQKWEVSFPKGLGAPEKISLPKLFSLHRHEDEGVKYFSGTATYKTNFVVKPSMMSEDRVVFLDLGAVEVMAEVIVNGVNKGIFWSRPYLIDVTDVLKPGENTLEIKVTNQWTNRLIGDEQLPEENEYVPGGGVNGIAALSRGVIRKLPDWYRNGVNKPEGGRVAFTTWKHYRKDSPLIESGLIGPVRLIPAKKIEFE